MQPAKNKVITIEGINALFILSVLYQTLVIELLTEQCLDIVTTMNLRKLA
jgi:hypothetical protein